MKKVEPKAEPTYDKDRTTDDDDIPDLEDTRDDDDQGDYRDSRDDEADYGPYRKRDRKPIHVQLRRN